VCVLAKLNISASRQDIKNQVCKFLATNMIIIPAKFQPSSSTGMGGKWDDIGRKRGDRRTRDVTPFSHDPYTKK